MSVMSVCPSACLSVCLSVWRCDCLFYVCLPVFTLCVNWNDPPLQWTELNLARHHARSTASARLYQHIRDDFIKSRRQVRVSLRLVAVGWVRLCPQVNGQGVTLTELPSCMWPAVARGGLVPSASVTTTTMTPRGCSSIVRCLKPDLASPARVPFVATCASG